MGTKLLVNCPNPVEANLIKAGLEDAGIYCFLTNENFSSAMPVYYNTMGMGVRVMVDEDDYEEALSIIESDNSAEIEDK